MNGKNGIEQCFLKMCGAFNKTERFEYIRLSRRNNLAIDRKKSGFYGANHTVSSKFNQPCSTL